MTEENKHWERRKFW